MPRDAHPVETRCDGLCFRWLKRCASRRLSGSIPWPSWPVSRLIPAPFSPENCSLPYMDRATTDTITSGPLWRRALRPGWSRERVWAATRPKFKAELFAVDDTLAALQRLGAYACETWRQARPGRLVGAVAGSVGKTTTKEILAALLGARFRVLKTLGNLNNEYGLPLTLLRLGDEYDAAVVELGMSHRGELAALTRIASPDVGLITRVAVEHLEFFSSIEEIALAERELIENLPWPGATAVLNADDERVARFAEVARGPVIFFGTGGAAKFRAAAVEEQGIEGLGVRLRVPARPHAAFVAADRAAQRDERDGRACGGEPVGHWGRGGAGRVSGAPAGRQARRSGAV